MTENVEGYFKEKTDLKTWIKTKKKKKLYNMNENSNWFIEKNNKY